MVAAREGSEGSGPLTGKTARASVRCHQVRDGASVSVQAAVAGESSNLHRMLTGAIGDLDQDLLAAELPLLKSPQSTFTLESNKATTCLSCSYLIFFGGCAQPLMLKRVVPFFCPVKKHFHTQPQRVKPLKGFPGNLVGLSDFSFIENRLKGKERG